MTTHPKTSTRAPLVRLITAGAPLALLAGTAAAADTELTQQTFQVSVGTFTNASKITIRADGETPKSGDSINWGDTFGDVDGTRFRLDSYWRINDRHHLRLMYTDNSSSRTKVLDRLIEWNGQEIPVDATVRTKFGFKIVELVYEYDFSKRPDRELVLSGGIHYTNMSADLEANYLTPGGGGTTTAGSEVAVKAPLPVIGGRGMWKLGGDFWLDAQVQLFQITFGDVDGSIFNYRAAFLWQPTNLFGVGAGYDSFGINVDAAGDNLNGKLRWTYAGPQIFFNLAF